MIKVKNWMLFFSIPLFVLSSCKQRKGIQTVKVEDKKIETAASFSLIDSVNVHSFRYKTIAAKIKSEFQGNDGNDISVTITMRGVRDSAIWMSVSPALGIEAARILFTRDSVKIMDKIHGQYAVESYDYLKRFSSAEISFDMLQNILTGNAAFITAPLVTDSITSHYAAHCTQNGLLQQLILSKLFRVSENNIIEAVTADKITVTYSDFQYVEREYFPFDIKILATSKGKKATILMNYSNVSVDGPVEIRFNIPASYSKMKY